MTWSKVLLPEIVSDFRSSYPNYRLNIYEGSSISCVQRVYEGGVDLGVSQKPIRLYNMDFVSLHTDEFVVACHCSNPLAQLNSIDLEDLKGHVCMRLLKDDVFSRLDWIEFEGGKSFPDTLVNAYHYTTILSLVDRNIGIAIMPRMANHQFDSDNIVLKPFSSSFLRCTVGLLTKKEKVLSDAAQHLKTVVINSFET